MSQPTADPTALPTAPEGEPILQRVFRDWWCTQHRISPHLGHLGTDRACHYTQNPGPGQTDHPPTAVIVTVTVTDAAHVPDHSEAT